jgi:dTDP-glucose 4,6-dehydratase
MQLLSGKKELRLGDIRPKRDFSYVKDICQGFLEVAKSEKTVGEEVNVCSGVEVSINELCETIISLISPDSEVKIIQEEERVRPQKSEVMRLLGNCDKLRSLTKWEPKYSLEKGLSETIKWIKQNLGRYKAEIYNV